MDCLGHCQCGLDPWRATWRSNCRCLIAGMTAGKMVCQQRNMIHAQQRSAISQKGVSQFILNLISLTPRLEFPGVMGFNIAVASLLFVALILLICGYASYKALHQGRASFRCSKWLGVACRPKCPQRIFPLKSWMV